MCYSLPNVKWLSWTCFETYWIDFQWNKKTIIIFSAGGIPDMNMQMGPGPMGQRPRLGLLGQAPPGFMGGPGPMQGGPPGMQGPPNMQGPPRFPPPGKSLYQSSIVPIKDDTYYDWLCLILITTKKLYPEKVILQNNENWSPFVGFLVIDEVRFDSTDLVL